MYPSSASCNLSGMLIVAVIRRGDTDDADDDNDNDDDDDEDEERRTCSVRVVVVVVVVLLLVLLRWRVYQHMCSMRMARSLTSRLS